jgi:CheY-like chemotaxis protein
MFHPFASFSPEQFWKYLMLREDHRRLSVARKKLIPASMKTLLEVDDDFSVRESVKKVFGEAGYEAVLAAGGLEELARLLANEIDVVLLDINIPSQKSWRNWQRLACGPFQAPVNFAGAPARRKNSPTAISAEWILENPNDGHPLPQRIQLLLARSNEFGVRHSQGISYQTTA